MNKPWPRDSSLSAENPCSASTFVRVLRSARAAAARAGDHRLRLVIAACLDATDREHALAVVGQELRGFRGFRSAYDENHADAAVEHAKHLGGVNVPFALKPFE